MTRPDPLVFSVSVTRPDLRMDPTRGQLCCHNSIQRSIAIASHCLYLRIGLRKDRVACDVNRKRLPHSKLLNAVIRIVPTYMYF